MFLFTVQFLPLPSPSFILGYLEFWGLSSVCTCIFHFRGVGEGGAGGAIAPPLLGQLPPDPPRRGMLRMPLS